MVTFLRSSTLACAAVLLVACGGDDDAASEPPPPTPAAVLATGGQSAWERNADFACAALLARFHESVQMAGPSFATRIEEAIRLGRTDLAMLEGMRPPRRARQGADVIAAALAVQLIALQELADADAEGNEARARHALARARDARRRARPYAERLGLVACARAAERRR